MAALKWAASNVMVVFLSIIFVTQTTAMTVVNENESDITVNDINDVLKAIERLVLYFKDNVETFNLDGFFGLRVLEGHLQLLIQEQKAGHHKAVPPSIWDRIVGLSKAAASVSEIGQDFVRRDDSKYFEDFSQVVEKPWAVLKQPRKLLPSLRWEIPQYKAKLNVRLTEDLSDRCMKEVMNASYSSICFITEECAKIMTTRGLTGYGITHQILWSILAEMSSSCDQPLQTTMKKHNMVNVSNFQLEMCTNNFYEMVAIVHVLMKGKVDESHQDLFLEQQFICPSLGFYEFLKKDYLRQILSWQFPSGCFGEAVHGSEEDYTADEKKFDVAQLLENYHKYKDTKSDQKPNGDNFAPKNRDTSNAIDAIKAINKPIKVPSKEVLNKNKQSSLTQKIVSSVDVSKNSLHFSNSHVLNKAQGFKNGISHHQPYPANNDNLKNTINSNPKVVANSNFNIDKKGRSQNVPNVVNFAMKINKTEETLYKEINQRVATGRKLLVEKQLEGGCLSHKTGVASGALVMYLHYLIKPGNIKWSGHHELFLSDTRNLLQAENKVGHFQDMHSVDPSITHANKDEGEKEEDEEEALDEDEDEEDEDEDLEIEDEEDDETDANYNDFEGWEIPSEILKARAKNAEKADTNAHRGEVIINKDGKQHVVDYANLDGQDADVRIDSKQDKGGKKGEEEGHYYYDDENEVDNNFMKRRLPVTARPYPSARVRKKHRNNENIMYSHEDEETLSVNTPNISLLVLVSITPFILIVLFLVKFFRRGRVPWRYFSFVVC